MASERIEGAVGSANAKLEETVHEKPFLQHLLDFGIVAKAVAIGLVGALIMLILVGPASAGFVLLLLFFGSWFALARVSYDRRRETEAADEKRADEDEDEGESPSAGSGRDA
jgi:flagellar biosynthesis/type III secretory pathway M-ring protein FliF/YscJ